MRSGMPGYGRRTGAAAPPGTVALGRLTARKSPCTDQNKSFRGFFTTKIYTEMVLKNIQVQMYLMQELNVVQKQCIQIGCH